MKIIKGDQVKIKIGKDKGRTGEVIRVFAKERTVVVKGLNLFKKHLKPQNKQKGGIIEKERPLAVSKLALICPNCQKITRIGYQVDKTGDKFRICKKCQGVIQSKTKTK
ncbi:50S ribosomal protein L24 [Candidatus Shapirobacteria bacterium RBG_13_44_7]|uniref:Large ribosomal subunit protein uL24 n=1 Tax=Candidatus Shapirobacteria bacterium RBG_13_44_7 TaxID=1802149 RepID=A0A1F7SK01_9BACT|nr:MAG: 50S ribosomal protein L24 [Candidatus Shapirobacteria bacterium RBG_13_44_7]